MNLSDKPIYVTRPSLPPLEEYYEYLKKIWDSKLLTNFGPFHEQLEKEMAEYLGVKYLSLFANGTLALISALKTLDITGEVITTPFSFVATSHSLLWNNLKPVFVDIEPNTFNIDPDKIEAAITQQTRAIMPVHVYGNPCNVDRIKSIADSYGLRIIYDACHSFGVKTNGKSIMNSGDLSVMSFHATKVFNTFEGGAIVCHDSETKMRIDSIKNFGFVDETLFVAPGINAKMNELQAAMGLLQLKYIDGYIEKRNKLSQLYREELKGIAGITCLFDIKEVSHNYSYFPILIDKSKFGKSRDEVYDELKLQNIFARRYYYPLISQFPTYSSMQSANPKNLPVSERVASQILCLPIYPDLDVEIIFKISSLLKQ